jgi:hypothetical protein
MGSTKGPFYFIWGNVPALQRKSLDIKNLVSVFGGMLTEHLRCLKVTAHERDPKKADEDLETRSQNEGPKQSPSSLS